MSDVLKSGLMNVAHRSVRCGSFVLCFGQQLSQQELPQPFFPPKARALQYHVERVEERVDGRVEWESEDGHGDTHLPGDGHAVGGQQPQ